MFNQTNIAPKGWLAFELNVLRRLKFASAAIPFTPDAGIGTYLKRWNTRVLANDLTLAGWTKAVASIENNGKMLSEQEVEAVLEDAYVPRFRLNNQALRIGSAKPTRGGSTTFTTTSSVSGRRLRAPLPPRLRSASAITLCLLPTIRSNFASLFPKFFGVCGRSRPFRLITDKVISVGIKTPTISSPKRTPI
jgi:hypothetical protein